MPNEASEKYRLRELIIKRSSAKGQITKFKNYLNGIANKTELNNIQLTELNLKLAKFEALSVRVDDLQNEIEVLNPDNISAEVDERDNIEQDIIMNIATAKTLIEKFTKRVECEHRRSSVLDNSCCSDHQEVGLKLPQIQIAKFDGTYFRWLEFRDTFESLIHNNSRITPIHKYHYLISYLEGDAARIISNLEVSSSNYFEAWSLLCNRYNNKRILINYHLNSLFNVKQLPRESERSLRFLVDHVTKNLRALASLGQPTDQWDVLIIFMLSSKLDSDTLTKWEEHRNSFDNDAPTLDQFYKFMIDRADVLESLNRNKHESNNCSKNHMVSSRHNSIPNSNTKQGQSSYTKSFVSSEAKSKSNKAITYLCIICNNNHKIYDCSVFKAKSFDEKMQDVTKYKLCVNCLRQGHPVSECRMRSCRECNKRHNSLLHRPASSANLVAINDESNEVSVNLSNQISNQTILSTALIEVANPQTQQKMKVRALLDCGSQSSFISKSLKNKIALKSYPIDCLKVIGIGNHVATNIVERCNINIKSLSSTYKTQCSCLVLNEITGYIPKCLINKDQFILPEGIVLADPTYYKPAPIEVLIGADLFWDILGNEQLSLGPNNPKLRKSQLGWIISGSFNSGVSNSTMHCNHAISYSSEVPSETDVYDIQQSLAKFWELEDVPAKNGVLSGERENICEVHFKNNTIRDETGRFSVRLPLTSTPDCLGDTYTIAKRRFNSLEKRFRKNTLLKSEYVKFMDEYSKLGHLSLITKETTPYYHLCHHAVLKQESESTKLRVVFDGSAPSTSGYSLNDILMVGPNIQDSLFSILIRARQYKFLLTGDIEKMYRQVMVDERDRKLQCILWRNHESEPIKIYQLNTVTYGTASASFLSTRCLWQIGSEQENELIRTIIQRDFYIDDVITGANDEQMLRFIQASLATALKSGCFNLRKYKSNNPSIFDNIDVNKNDNLTFSESSSTLGLGWTPSTDTLHIPIKIPALSKETVVTKRSIMSNSFKIFDPLGLLSPVVIQPKIILQKVWQLKLNWDDEITNEIKDEWLKIATKMNHLEKLKIPRLVLCDSPKFIEMHTFSDASQVAYGACIYMRSIGNTGEIKVHLLCSKSKVAPLKPTTIPRLELCAALLAAKLCNSVLNSLRERPTRIIHWCDSSVVLSWINCDLSKLKTFVSNRINEIIELTSPSAWRYVPTAANPADLISRGVDSQQLLSMKLWWSGPDYLHKNESDWPVLRVCNSKDLPEIKVNSVSICEPFINFERYSSLNRLQRAMAYIIRFIHNIKNPKNKRYGSLSVHELSESFNVLCLIAQRESFPVEYNMLSQGKPLSNKSKILSLSPFIDENKLIRVGGRLSSSIYSYEKKHPVLLHSNHKLTKLYFDREHLINMHAGPQLLLATVREVVWPVNGRYLARRTVNNCVRCRRVRGKTLYPKMGDLPSQRVNPDYPFLSVGLDFAGPFLITNRKGRGSRVIKCYLCLFVCLRYKCIHLEAVSDLTKEAFIMTLRRFIARRGKPKEIFSDNGRNFVAAAKDIGRFIEQNEEPLNHFATQQGIVFKFIPTYAPHFGGIWEAGVKSAKHHLKRVMGTSHITFEEISTLFAQVEAILNSRPLCPLSSQPDDLLFLSPGHFLIGRPLTSLPSPIKEDTIHGNTRNRYELLETIRQHFWKRWQREYLAELQQRTKWRQNTSRLNVQDMVLLAEDNAPPLQWRLGRVLQLFPGPDGISRVADVLTTKGVVRRPLVRLCPLPTADELQN